MSPPRRRFTEEEIDHLRDRVLQLGHELQDVLDAIVEKVTTLNEELDESDISAALAEAEAHRHVHRPTGR